MSSGVGPEFVDSNAQDESERKLQAKKLVSDLQKKNELILLEAALRRAEKQ